jgi:TDG/mug DNA glycosylase family protein
MSIAHALPDLLQHGLRVVFCGTAAGEKSAAVGAYYAGSGNQFWRALHAVGLTPRRLQPADFRVLSTFGIGLTDIAKCRAGTDVTLRGTDFDVPGFRTKIEQFAPQAIAFNGKKSAAVFYACDTGDLSCGRQSESIGTTAVWVLPSTSGSARGYWDLEPWRLLATSLPLLP